MFLLAVVKSLSAKKVRYAIAGGYAVSLHGAVRTTFDIDLVVEWTLENLAALEEALSELRLQSRLPVAASDIFHFREEYISKRNLIAWSFVNSADPSQLVDVILTEDLREMKSVSVSVLGVRVPILGVESLVKMKERSGRPQDLEDIRALRRLK